MMQAGRLNTRCVIQRRTGGTNDWGEPLPEGWETHATVWANVKHLSGSEAIKADAEVSTVRGTQTPLSQIEATELYIKQKMRMP